MQTIAYYGQLLSLGIVLFSVVVIGLRYLMGVTGGEPRRSDSTSEGSVLGPVIGVVLALIAGALGLVAIRNSPFGQ